MVTDATGTPLNVRRFDGKVIVALHNGENDGILRASAERIGKPSAYVAERQTLGLSGVHHLLLKRTRVAGGEPPRVCRRLFRLSHAAMAGSSSVA